MKSFATKDIVYASDLEKNDLEVIKKLLDVAAIFESNFHILHIVGTEKHPNAEDPKVVFEHIVAETAYPSLSFHQIEQENISDAISNFVATMPCDILAMAIHHRSFFGKLFHRSLTKKMVNHSHIPVLTYYK